ncbi:MAG: Uma2 family endonuclease [bacterium]|nr:Uma2 family endonuclease [bacterium]
MAVAQVLEKKQQTGRLRWEEYAQQPPTGERAEIVNGEVVPLAGASAKHQRVLGNLYLLLSSDPRVKQEGAVLFAPFDVVVSREPLRVRQPDLLFVRYQKMGDPSQLDEMTRLEVAPDLIVEVLSPSDTVENLNARLQDYHTLGVSEVWLVDLVPNHVFVLWRAEEGWKWNEPVKGEQPPPTRQLTHVQITPKAIFGG